MRKRDFRIEIEDERLFPVQAFFNAISDNAFVRIMLDLKRGVGSGVNDCFCEFPNELDPGEEPFEGVRFSLFEDEVVLSLNELNKYIDQVCEVHLADFPEDRERLYGKGFLKE